MLGNRLLLATGNPGKLAELRALLKGIPTELVSAEEVGVNPDVTEDGNTYTENASKKAAIYSEMSGLVALADDSGLEVDALDGAPGLHSRRYLSRGDATDAERRAHLLSNLQAKPRPWTARFRAAVAVAAPGRAPGWAEGECRGEIVPEERGEGGFGYDRIFLVAGTGLTMAELSMDEKNVLSHRANAVREAMPIIMRFLGH
jgi:XTP/dITP diphosphohydrolase